ncbi:MAG: LEPR-XLL domain-containing protein, partial [Opitutales bacterium]|nr:LEPR-XLL domain-containing protein [Opitutales bacterium]
MKNSLHFKVEGLESRILLSATPLGDGDVFEEEESSQIAYWEEMVDENELSEEGGDEDLFAAAEPMGEPVADPAAGSSAFSLEVSDPIVYLGTLFSATEKTSLTLAPELELSGTEVSGVLIQVRHGALGDQVDADDRLVFNNDLLPTGVTGSFSGGDLTFSGAASVVDYRALLRSVQFEHEDHAAADLSERTINWEITFADGDSEAEPVVPDTVIADEMILRMATLDEGIEGIFEDLDDVFGDLFEHFFNQVGSGMFSSWQPNNSLVPEEIRESTDIIPYINSNFRDLIFPQKFVETDDGVEQRNDYGITLQPWDVGRFFDLGEVFSPDSPLSGFPFSYLSEIGDALTDRFNFIAGTILDADTWDVSVAFLPMGTTGFTMAVEISATKDVGDFVLELGLLQDDLGLRLTEDLTFGAGGGVELAFNLDVDLADYLFDDSSVADANILLEFENIRGTAGFQFSDENLAIEIGMLRGTTVDMSGRLFGALPMAFTGEVQQRQLNSWQTSHFGNFFADGGEIQLEIPIAASLFGQTVTEPDTKIEVFVEDIFANTTPIYTATSYERVQAFSLIDPEEVIQSILDAGDIFRLLQNSGEELFGIPLPFLEDIDLGEVFSWASLFASEIGDLIDINEILLVTPGTDALTDIRLDPDFEGAWLFDGSTDALIRNQIRIALVLNNDLSNYREITIAESSSRNVLNDLVADINAALDAIGGLYGPANGGLRALNISESLAFFAPSGSGISSMHLVPHPEAPGDLQKFSLMTEELVFLDAPVGSGWNSSFKLDPTNPLVGDVSLSVTVDDTTEIITLNRVAGETANAMLVRLATALQNAFGENKVDVFALVEGLTGELEATAEPTAPFTLRLQRGEEANLLDLNFVDLETAGKVVPLGFFVGDNASTPRPGDLLTFQDFVDSSIIGRVPDAYSYNPTTGVVSFGFFEGMQDGDTITADLDLNLTFASVSQISPNATAQVTLHPEFGFGFVIDFLLLPKDPITFSSDSFEPSGSFTLSGDAEFTVNFVLGNEYDVVVEASDTTGNTSLQDLVGDINSALRTATNVADGSTVNLTLDSFVAWANGNRIEFTNALHLGSQSSPFLLENENGVLEENVVIALTLGDADYLIPLFAGATQDFTNFGQLIGYVNTQMASAFIDIDENGEISSGDELSSLQGLVFATTFSGQTEAFHLYTTGPPQPHWPFTANILAPEGEVFAEELNFSGPTFQGQLRLTSSVEGVETRIRGFDGDDLEEDADLVFGKLTYDLPTAVSGTASLGFNQIHFGELGNSGQFSVEVAAREIVPSTGAPFSVNDVLSEPADTLSIEISGYPLDFWISLEDISAPGVTIDESASIRFTIPDFRDIRIEKFVDQSLPIPLFHLELVDGVPNGNIKEDTTVTFYNEGDKYEVTVTVAEAADFTEFAELVALFNEKLEEAVLNEIDGVTFDVSDQFNFRAERNLLQLQVLREVSNPDYVVLDILPDLQAFGTIGSQTGFSTQSVVDGMFLALAGFEDLFADPDSFFSQPLPIINTAMNAFWHLPGDFAARISTLQQNPASSADQLPGRIAQAFGLSASEVQVVWDDDHEAFRIEFSFITGTRVDRPVDINPKTFAQFAEGSGDGLDRLIDGANRSPATFQGLVTFNIALGIDLTNPSEPRFFLYEFEEGTEGDPDTGTSISVDFNIYAEGIDFTSSKKALGLFIRDGIAILAGEPQEHNGETVYLNLEDQNRTPFLLHLHEQDFANLTMRLGQGQASTSDGKYYLGGTEETGETAFSNEAFDREIIGSVQVVLPIYTPTETINLFSNRMVEGLTIIDPDTGTGAANQTGIVGGNVFELRIFDYGQFVEDQIAWPELTGAEKGAVQASGNVDLYVPDPESDAGIETPTLLDLLRDPALILDGIDFFFGTIQAGLSAVGNMPIPIVGPAFAGAANTIFSFRDGWLQDMRNRLRGAGEAFGQLAKESIFRFLGPDGAGILLEINGISGLEGQVEAGSPDAVIFDWLDENGDSLTDKGGFGAHGLEFQIRLGQVLLDTGFNADLDFSALEPVFNLGLDGGFGFAVGWDLQIGFGFNLDDGFYIKVDGDRNELDIRVEGTLRGAQEYFEVRPVDDPDLPNFPDSDAGTGFGIWNRRDQEWAMGPPKGDGSRMPLYVINVDAEGNILDLSEWESNLIFGGNLSRCGCSTTEINFEEPDNFWVIAGFDSETEEWAPAYLDQLGQFRAQEGSFDTDQMIQFDRAQPFVAFGSLFFLNVEATDQIRVGLEPPGDADYYFGFEEDQITPNDRNDEDEGVRRNNHLPSRAVARIGINLWDPSEQSSDNDIIAGDSITGWVGADWNGEVITDLGLSFTEENPNGFPMVSFNNLFNTNSGDLWFIVNLVDEDNANDIRDFFLSVLEENEWKMEIERRPSFGSVGITYEMVSFVDGEWVYLDGDDEWQPLWDEDWVFVLRIPDEFGSGTTDIIRVKYIQLGDPYYDITENGTGWYIVDPDYAGVEDGAVFDSTNGLLEPIFLFDEVEDDWEVPLFMLLSTGVSLNDLAAEGRLNENNFTSAGGQIPSSTSDFTDVLRWGYWLPVLPVDFDPSENMITWEELRGPDSGNIIQLTISADIIVNLSVELSVSDDAAFPKIRADLNLDWGFSVNLLDEDPFGEVNWYPHLGVNDIRLDMGSFLTQYMRPLLAEIDDGLDPVRPLIEILTDPIPVISDIAGRNISLSNLLYQFGGPKGQAIATFIDVVRLVSDLSAIMRDLPDDMNVYLPMGNFWIPSSKDGLGEDIFYDNNELTAPSFSQQNQSLIGDGGLEEAQGAFDALTGAPGASLGGGGGGGDGSGPTLTFAASSGGFGFPILSDPTQIFSLLMGGDAVLVTYSLPSLDFSLGVRIPIVQLGPFQVGIRFAFDINAQMHFGYDTYGIRKVLDTGNPFYAIDGLFISDTANPDGSGRDIPEFSLQASMALYGGIDVWLARGGIEGGFSVTASVDLNDPNADGRIRLSELYAIVDYTGNPLDWFNISVKAEVFARYYYKVMIPVPYPFGIKRVTILEGGKTFARITLFDFNWEGSLGPPVLGEMVDFVTPDGDIVSNALLLNMGPNSEARISRDDPFYDRNQRSILDGNERFVITNNGSTVTVQLLNRTGSGVFYTQVFDDVSMVVAYAGEGNDTINASGLNGLRVFFEGMEGNNHFTVGSTHATNASWIIGGTGNDTLTKNGSGYTYFDGISGSNTITLGSGDNTVNVVDAGRDADSIGGGGDGANNHIRFGSAFGDINLSDLGLDNESTLIDFSQSFFPLSGQLSRANSFIEAGGNRRATFHLAAITEFRGSQNRDDLTFRDPHTHSNGLLLRGGLGNDVFTFVLGDFDDVSTAGITIDNDIVPMSLATLGLVTMDDCDGIAEIAMTSGGSGYLVAPDVRITDATGTGARAVAGLNPDGTLSGIIMTNRGEGYSDNPTIELINRTSMNDTVRFVLEDVASFSQEIDLSRISNQHVLEYEDRHIRMTDSVENITIQAAGADVSVGSGGVSLEGRFNLRAERFINTGPITADTILLVADQGFAVDHPISTINNGSITMEVLGRGDTATATPVISGGQVTGYSLNTSGSFYNFAPQVVVRGGSSGAGAGAFAEGVVNSSGEVTDFIVHSVGSNYSSIPVPDAYITAPGSIYLNASVSTSALGSAAGTGDGRGTITLRTLEGSVLTSASVDFPANSEIAWQKGDFRFLGDKTLDDIIAGGSGAEAEAILDGDGRVVGFTILNGGQNYTTDFLPTVKIEGAAEASAIIEGGQIVGFNIVNPGGGYAVAPKVEILSNGLAKIGDGVSTKHIKAANGFLVLDAHEGVGNIIRPVQTDTRVFVARGTELGNSAIYILENNGFDIGLVDSINGVTTKSSDIHLVSFSGDMNLGMPVQRTNSAGELLWQDAEKTIPLYETYTEPTVIGGREFLPGDLVFVGGNLNADSGNIVMVADNFNVNAVVSSTGANLLSLRPSDPTATLGLAGSRAIGQAILDENGTVIGVDIVWQGRGYADEPLVIFNAPGDRAFAVATALGGAVSSIEVTFGGTFYTEPPVVTLSAPQLAGGTQATAQAILENGSVVGIEILNAGSGYTSSPKVDIAMPGQQATARAQVQNGRVVGFFDLQGGSNYSFVPRVTIGQPFTFGLDQFEIDFFQAGFDNFQVGREDGRNKVVTATQQFQETTILRGDSHFFENTFVDGDLFVYGSGNTSFFDTGTTEADSITINDALIVNPGQTHTFRATAGGIFFQLPGTVNGTLPNSSTNPDNQENIILDATGNIQIVGAIGNNAKIHNLTITQGANITFNDTITLSGDLIIENGAQITFERDVRIDGNLIIGDENDLSQIGSVTFTPGARLDVQGDVEIYTNGAVNFRNDVGQVFGIDNFTVVSNDVINFEGRFTADQADLTAGNDSDLYFNQQVRVNNMHARAGNLLRVDSTISVGTGDLTLTANRVELLGGSGSIRNQSGTSGMSVFTIEPFTVSRNMAVGAPVFFFGEDEDRLNITYREIAAISTGFVEVIFGDVENGSGDVLVSDLGSTPNNFTSSPPPIQNPTTIVGGRVQVGYANDTDFFDADIEDVFEFIPASHISVSSAAAFLRFKSLVSDVKVDAAINTFIQRNPWIRIEAEQNIIINKPVQALTRISLTSGYSGDVAGSVIVNSVGEDTGHLFTTSSSTSNHRIEISAGRVGGVNGGNILFNDVPFTGEGGDITVWARNAGSRVLMQAPGGTITQNNGLIRAEILSLTALGNITLDLTDVVRVDEGTISGATLWKDGFVKDNGDDVIIDGIIITGDPDFVGSANLRMTETDGVILVNVQTNGGDIFIDNLEDSEGDLELGTIGAVRGEIRLVADGAITDYFAGDEIVNLTTTGIANLTAKTGIGAPGDEDIDTLIGSLTAQTTVSGGIHIDERDGLMIVGPVTTAGNGPILISVREGDLNVASNVTANGSGNVLLEVLQGSANIETSVSSTEGHISITAEESINILASGSISTGEPGTVFIHSANGEIVMSELSSVTATGSSVYLTTTGLTEGDIYLAAITADRVSVVSAHFSIFTALGSSANVTATDLRLEAARAIGTSTTPIYTTTTNLAAYADGVNPSFTGIFIQQTGDVTVNEINPIEVQIVDTDNVLTSGGDTDALADLRTGNSGSIVLVATGSVTLNDGNFNGASVVADQSGNILIRANGETSDLTVNGAVSSGTGHITLRAERNIEQNDDITTGAPGTVLIIAETGSFTMDREVVTTATNSSVLIRSEGHSTLGLLVGTDVSVRSFNGSIFSAVDSTMNVTATNLRLQAENAIGTTDTPILTTVDHLTAHANSTSTDDKGIYIHNAISVIIRDVEVTVQEVLANATTSSVTEISQADLVTDNDGDIVLTTVDGTITLTDSNGNGSAVNAQGSGEVILTANGDDRDIIAEDNADILGGTGDITLTSDRNIVLDGANVDFITAGDAEISLTATNGFIFMGDGSTIVNEDGDINLYANSNINVSLIESATGDLFLHAENGYIRDNTALEEANLVTDGTAHLKAATGIGANATQQEDINTRVAGLTAFNTVSGDIIIQEETGLTLTDDDDLTLGGVVNNAIGGDVRILTLANRITVDGEVRTASGNEGSDYGHIALRGIAADTELVVNAAITATNGHITLRADRLVEIYAPVETNQVGTILVVAPAANAEIVIENDGEETFGALITENQNIVVESGNNAQIAGIDAGTANVEVAVINGAITSGGREDLRDVTAENLRLRAQTGIGTASDPMLTDISLIAAYTVEGPIQISNVGSLTIDTVAMVEVTEVLYASGLAAFGSIAPGSDQPISDIRTDGDGDVLIISENGSITINDGVNADGIGVQSQGGNIVVEAAIFIDQNANILTNGSGTIEVEAKDGDITMLDGTTTQTEEGTITYTASGDIFLSLLESTAGGNITVDAGDRIRDNTLLEEPNIRTSGLATLLAVNGIGDVGVEDINMDVGSVTGTNTTSGRIVLREVDTLEIASGGLTTQGGNGDIIVTVEEGNLTVNGMVTAHGSGNILLETLGTDADIFVNANVSSTEGHITLQAERNIDLSALVEIRTSEPGTLSIEAVLGSITMAGTAAMVASNSSARLRAHQAITLGSVLAADVSLISSFSSVTRATGSGVNVTASNLRIWAWGSIAQPNNPLSISVDTLTAHIFGSSMSFAEQNGVTISSVRVEVSSFIRDATLSPVIDESQSDLATINDNGRIILVALDGDIVLEDGNAAVDLEETDGRTNDGNAVLADGSGSIHLHALNGSLMANASILSGTGLITIKGNVDVELNENVEVKTNGSDVSIDAETGDLTMDGSVEVEATDATVRLRAENTVTVANVTGRDVSILAVEGAIVNAAGTSKNVTATNLRLEAEGDIGTADRHLTTNIENLTALSRTGGIYLTEDNAATVTSVRIDWTEFESDATTTDHTDFAQSDLTTLENGHIILVVLDGDLILDDGDALVDQTGGDEREANGIAVSANGTGSILLDAEQGSVIANASI